MNEGGDQPSRSEAQVDDARERISHSGGPSMSDYEKRKRTAGFWGAKSMLTWHISKRPVSLKVEAFLRLSVTDNSNHFGGVTSASKSR